MLWFCKIFNLAGVLKLIILRRFVYYYFTISQVGVMILANCWFMKFNRLWHVHFRIYEFYLLMKFPGSQYIDPFHFRTLHSQIGRAILVNRLDQSVHMYIWRYTATYSFCSTRVEPGIRVRLNGEGEHSILILVV